MINSKILGDRQGVFGGTSMRVMINRYFCHSLMPFKAVDFAD